MRAEIYLATKRALQYLTEVRLHFWFDKLNYRHYRTYVLTVMRECINISEACSSLYGYS